MDEALLTLVSGLIGAGGALLGALVGAMFALRGQRILSRNELVRRRIAITKAILNEMQFNARIIAIRIPSGGDFGTVSDAVWRKTNLEIAEFLDSATYMELTLVYANQISLDNFTAKRLPTKTTQADRRTFNNWIDNLILVSSKLLDGDYGREFADSWPALDGLERDVKQKIRLLQQLNDIGEGGGAAPPAPGTAGPVPAGTEGIGSGVALLGALVGAVVVLCGQRILTRNEPVRRRIGMNKAVL